MLGGSHSCTEVMSKKTNWRVWNESCMTLTYMNRTCSNYKQLGKVRVHCVWHLLTLVFWMTSCSFWLSSASLYQLLLLVSACIERLNVMTVHPLTLLIWYSFLPPGLNLPPSLTLLSHMLAAHPLASLLFLLPPLFSPSFLPLPPPTYLRCCPERVNIVGFLWNKPNLLWQLHGHKYTWLLLKKDKMMFNIILIGHGLNVKSGPLIG